jgi:uncharacterized protein YceH (UPF0502 family)
MIDSLLNAVEIRVLGSLIEKELTTPEYYPLTLNALTNACNQKNNREPVVSLEESSVARAIESLREKKLVFAVTGAGIRVPKYRHNLTETLTLTKQETAVMCLLMLRGPQTLGEVRGRSGTMVNFESLPEVQATFDALGANEKRQQLVKKLPRQPGQKEARFAHLLSGEPAPGEQEDSTRPEKAVLQVRAENERIAELEAEVDGLKTKIESLQQQFTGFKKQFE